MSGTKGYAERSKSMVYWQNGFRRGGTAWNGLGRSNASCLRVVPPVQAAKAGEMTGRRGRSLNKDLSRSSRPYVS